MNKLIDYANEFNSSVKFLARVYALKKKGTFEEEKALRTNKRLAIVISSEPMFIMENSGPFFLRYADMIQNREWDKLMEQNFTEEKNSYKASDDGNKHSYDDMDSKINFIKNVFASCDVNEKESMGDTVQTMLSAYCKYALQVKTT
jgi:hypothetical protein